MLLLEGLSIYAAAAATRRPEEDFCMKRMALLVAFALVALACGGGSARRQMLIAKAASDFKCNPASVQREEMEGFFYYERAMGCGKENWYIFDGTQWISPLDRAAFEMSCPRENMTSSMLDKTTIGVTGCDKKGVYVLLPAPGGAKWVLNSSDDSRDSSKSGKGAETAPSGSDH